MLLIPGDVHTSDSETTFLSKYAALLSLLLRVGDVVIVVVAAFLCYGARFHTLQMGHAYVAVVLRAALLVLLIFPLFCLYRSWRGERVATEVGRAALAWLAVLTVLVFSEWAVKTAGDYSRLWMGGWAVATIIMLGIHRWVVRHLLGIVRRHGTDTRKVVVVGATQAGRKIIAATSSQPWMGLEVVGYVQTPYDQRTVDDMPPLLGDVDGFIESLRHTVPDQIWIGLPLRAEAQIQQLLDATVNLPTTVRLVPDMLGYELINHSVSTLAGVPVITLRGSSIDGHGQVLKAMEDRALATLSLLLLSPLMLLIALGVKLSSVGPVLYRQRRIGLDGKEFEMLKFRSMPVNVESDGVQWGNARDKQTTRFGRFIRRTSLDELPQFINVLKGEMSFVGPRPERPAFVAKFRHSIPGYMHKHFVKAGITGLAQINGWRGDSDLAKRIECDLFYINHWSIWLDLKIILLTPVALLKRTNAY